VVHANVQGNRLSVALRDGTLSESDALELYYRLRGQLRGAGYELAEMTINGQPVIPAA
jgi:hypothetical protein